jgi:uncharacterized protein
MNQSDNILKIGKVRSVYGRKVNVLVDKRKNTSHLILNGDVVKNVAVGSYIKIAKGFTEIIGKIEGESIEEDKVFINKEYGNSNEKIKRELIVNLVGFIENGKFYQGIKDLPLVENDCYLLRRDEFDIVHKFIKDEDAEDSIKIGVLASETGVPIELGVDNLFASHIGIFGNTGSGKSYTLAKIYHELFKKYKDNTNFKKNAKFLLIDFNGEYVNPKTSDKSENFPDIIVEGKFKSEYKLTTDTRIKDDNFTKFPISKTILKDLNFWTILLKATEQTQRPFLDKAINSSYLTNQLETENGIKSVISNNLSDFLTDHKHNQDIKFHIAFLEDLIQVGEGAFFKNLRDKITFYNTKLKFFSDTNGKQFSYDSGLTKYYSNGNVEDFKKYVVTDIINTLEINMDAQNELMNIHLKVILHYYYSIHKGYIQKDFIAPLIGRFHSKTKEINKVFDFKQNTNPEKQLVVVSLKNVNVEMRKIIPLIIAKEYYELHKKNNTNRVQHLNIIIDEAHNILSDSSNRESETWKDYRLETFEEIIKEGRKFGVFLTIASQRPFDISQTIISQLHNYFLHRLINNKDIEAIEKTVSYLDKVSFESIPILPQGTCVLAGLAAQLPVVIKIDEIKDVKEGEKFKVRYSPYSETIKLTNNWK